MKNKKVLVRLMALGMSASVMFSTSATVLAMESATESIVQMQVETDSEDDLKQSEKSAETIADENGFVIKNGVLIEYQGNDQSVIIPDGVTEIGDYAFAWCSSLTEIVIPNSVTIIGEGAFDLCTNLIEIIIPNSVSVIGNYAFSGCFDLEEIVLSDNLTTISSGMLSECGNLKKIVIPDGVTTIENYAFLGCYGFTEITIPDSVTSIGEGAFEECKDLMGNWGFTVYGYTNSYAQQYAEENEMEFVSLGEIKKNPFSDVSKDQYYYEPVLWAVENEITTGLNATTFGPEQSCTRGQVVTFLWRAKGCPEPTKTENPFKDVGSNEYYSKAVLWAVENGITTGLNATTFAPEETVTRAQFVTFLHRAEGKQTANVENPFFDVKQDYYYDAVLWAFENGVTTGLNTTTFGTEEPCTRGQVVTFLYRALEKNKSFVAKLDIAKNTNQIILVEANGSQATISMHEKKADV